MFVNRELELKMLEEAFSSNRPELVLVYGRRRLGKTFLIRRFLAWHKGVYLVVNYSERGLALRDLSRQLSLLAGVHVSFEWFGDLLRFALKLGGERPLLVVDEFQRLAGTGLLSELQSFWDSEARSYNPMIVLVGSGVGVVERVALSYDSPIYGRVTRVLKLREFGYREARVFMRRWSPVERVRGYAVFGGTPYYLSLIDSSSSLEDNIAKLILAPGSPLHEEPIHIVYAETREPDRYLAILEAIARGHQRPVEIANYVGLPRDSIHKYLRILEEGLGLVKRTYPLGMEGKPRYARYVLADNFFNFWFSEVYPHMHMIQLDHVSVKKRIADRLDVHAARAWEQIALEHLLLLRRKGKASFTVIGKWWWKGIEIDLVALDEDNNRVYFVECKWGEATPSTLTDLIAKARAFPWRRGKREEVYIVYARQVRGIREDESVQVYTLEDVEKDFDSNLPLVED